MDLSFCQKRVSKAKSRERANSGYQKLGLHTYQVDALIKGTRKLNELSESSRPNSSRIYDFTITNSDVFAQGERQGWRCALTGIALQGAYNDIPGSPLAISIDRIDNDKGYTPDNIQLVILGANRMRNSMTMEEWAEFWTFDFLEECMDHNPHIRKRNITDAFE